MTQPTHRTINTNGIQMHIAEQGSGPLVLMCHGFPESWYSWRHPGRQSNGGGGAGSSARRLNAHRLFVTCAFANLFIVRHHLMRRVA